MKILILVFAVLLASGCGDNESGVRADTSYTSQTLAGVKYRNDSGIDQSVFITFIDETVEAMRQCAGVDYYNPAVVAILPHDNSIVGKAQGYYFYGSEAIYINASGLAEMVFVFRQELAHHILWTVYAQQGHDYDLFQECARGFIDNREGVEGIDRLVLSQ